MKWWERIFDLLFNAVISRQEGLTATAYILALATRQRHLSDMEPDDASSMEEAASFLIQYACKRDIPIHHLAISVYDELDRPLP